MMQVLISFGCGMAFAMGVSAWFFIQQLATAKGREELQLEIREHGKRVEERLSVQIRTMAACLEEIEKRKP